jgi:hypothetical protein
LSVTFSDEDLQYLDTGLLSSFIFEMNVSRRYVTAYPSSHPIINSSVAKALQLLTPLLESRAEIMVGIARDALFVGTGFLERSNQAHREFARHLFSLGIAAVTFRKGLQANELLRFNEVLCRRREQIINAGGIPALLEQARIGNIRVTEIDYGAFQTTEEDLLKPDRGIPGSQPDMAWEDFVRGMIEGTLNPAGLLQATYGNFDPEMLAAMLNQEPLLPTQQIAESVERTINALMRQLELTGAASRQRLEYLDKLGVFIGKLSPELRQQMLGSTFRALAGQQALAEDLLERLPNELILETLGEVNTRKSAIPPLILSLIEKMAQQSPAAGDDLAAPVDTPADEDMSEKLRVIFREENLADFVPDPYQSMLHTMIKTGSIGMPVNQELEVLKATLTGHGVETQVSAVILEIVNSSLDECDPDVLRNNLVDLCAYFLGLGDFGALIRIFDRLDAAAAVDSGARLRDEVLAVFAQPEFVQETLSGLVTWGKPKYPEIQAIIEKVGTSFVEPLLDRLAEEQNMSLRHFYINRLAEMGDVARDAVLERLRDTRWYYLRNLLVLLRRLNDPSVVRSIRRLTVKPHPKVRIELLKTMLHFRDPEADKILLQNMTQGDDEAKLEAISLAEKSQSPQVFRQLIGFLQDNKFTGLELELKSAVIRTLGEIGNPEALPHLTRLLNARSFLRSKMLRRLKHEIVGSLERYPVAVVDGLLRTIAGSANNELAAKAAEIRTKNGGRNS